MNRPLRIGTRGSALALRQAEWVRDRIARLRPGAPPELVIIRTEGDRRLDVSLPEIGGKGVFTAELEQALLEGRIDLAQHSLKDLPTRLPDGLRLGAVPVRVDPRDALVSREGRRLRDLPAGARVGTSALRRAAQLRHLRPDLDVQSIRGNVDTRLRKLAEAQFDAIVIALAGLERLGLADRAAEVLPVDQVLPAPGQGALALEARSDDPELGPLLERLHDREAGAAVAAERAVLEALGGGCQVPVAAHAERQGDRLRLRALVADLQGRRVVRAEGFAAWPAGGPPADVTPAFARALGESVAADLLRQGAGEILAGDGGGKA